MWSEKNWQHIFLISLGVACSEKVITLLVIRVAHALYIYRHLFLKNGYFLNIDISQGSVATRLGCDGVFVYDFVTNVLLSLTVKEF